MKQPNTAQPSLFDLDWTAPAAPIPHAGMTLPVMVAALPHDWQEAATLAAAAPFVEPHAPTPAELDELAAAILPAAPIDGDGIEVAPESRTAPHWRNQYAAGMNATLDELTLDDVAAMPVDIAADCFDIFIRRRFNVHALRGIDAAAERDYQIIRRLMRTRRNNLKARAFANQE